MSGDVMPLSDDERAELEQLRKERAQREAAERARVERAELERLRSEHAMGEQDARREEQRRRAASLMEPGEDLSMPKGQRIVLIIIAFIVVGILCGMFIMHP